MKEAPGEGGRSPGLKEEERVRRESPRQETPWVGSAGHRLVAPPPNSIPTSRPLSADSRPNSSWHLPTLSPGSTEVAGDKGHQTSRHTDSSLRFPNTLPLRSGLHAFANERYLTPSQW